MSKLERGGYTWWTKDWASDEKVFDLNPYQRGVYRELIDLAMVSWNVIEVNTFRWSRQWNADNDELEKCIDFLVIHGLLMDNGDTLSVPSCDKRLTLIKLGQNNASKRWSGEPNNEPIDTPIDEPNRIPIRVSDAKHKHKHKDKDKVKKVFTPPTLEEFMIYAKGCFKTNEEYLKYRQQLINKHKAWEANGWHNDYQNKPIKIWKTTLLNTINAWI